MKEETLTNLNFAGRLISWAVCGVIGVAIAAQLTGVQPNLTRGGGVGLARLPGMLISGLFTNWATFLGGLCGVGAGEAIIRKIISNYSKGKKS
jgi:hypothetical protein